ncbi:MAG: hypothetical protein IPL53_01025 [Ignavibacteria bacterium]|nr:hypothetical protein [Ignavibacteria bacterium]
MRTKSFFAMLVITSSIYNELSAQSISDITSLSNKGYWNLTYSIGIGKDLISNGYTQTPSNGFAYSVDASYTPKNNIGFFANYSLTDLNGSIDDITDIRRNNRDFNFSQITVGPRFFSNNKIFFIDAGLGYYNITGKKFIGLNAGAGAKIKFSDTYGILINGRIHNTFVHRPYARQKKEPFVYYGIYLGLELNNSKDKTFMDNKKNEFAVALLGGTFNSGLNFSDANMTFGAELSYDISSKVSVLFNYFYAQSEGDRSFSNGSIIFNDISNYSSNDFSGGLRLYLTGNNFKVFAESAVNLYFLKEQLSFQIFTITLKTHLRKIISELISEQEWILN